MKVTRKELKREPINIIDALVLIFLVLKTTNNFDYSWWVVFSPYIFGFILDFILLIIANRKEIFKNEKEKWPMVINRKISISKKYRYKKLKEKKILEFCAENNPYTSSLYFNKFSKNKKTIFDLTEEQLKLLFLNCIPTVHESDFIIFKKDIVADVTVHLYAAYDKYHYFIMTLYHPDLDIEIIRNFNNKEEVVQYYNQVKVRNLLNEMLGVY